MCTSICQFALVVAALCVFALGVSTWPTPFDEQSVEIRQIIQDHESGLIQEESFRNVISAMQQEE